MPTIIPRPSHNGKNSYQVKVRVKGFPPQSASFPTLTAAKQWGQRIEADLREHRYFPNAKAKRHSVGDLIDAYLADLKVRNPRRHREVLQMLNWWKGEIGSINLLQFSGAHVLRGQQMLMSRPRSRRNAEGSFAALSPTTVNRNIQALKSAVEFGIRPLKWLSVNPVKDVDSLEEPPGSTRFLTDDERSRLFAACKASKNPHLFTLVLLGVSTGGRREELRTLKWTDFVPEASQFTLTETKNNSVRALVLTGPILELISKKWESRGDAVYVFPSPSKPSRPIDFESAWRHALKIADIKNFRFHDLRHTFGSYLAMNGASNVELMEALGHKTLAMAQRYSHLGKSHTASVIGRMTGKELGNVEI